MSRLTRVLNALDAGDPRAADQILPLVYEELRRLAAAKLSHEQPGQTLDATALVHEAYLRLIGGEAENDAARTPQRRPEFANRRHFFAAAAEAMRRILIEQARRKARERHGGDRQRVELESEMAAVPEPDERLILLDRAFDRLASIEPEKAELLKLRWFAGLTLDEAAEALGISPSTADRWWAYARAWLRVEACGEKPI